ncbi:MAG: response regulator [Holophagaceae bacterium]|nr:response regulator [Holophagaceae bacterium]
MSIDAPVPNQRGRVLVVDDSPALLAPLCELLYEDHEVIFATSGQEAIDLAHSHNPDLILLDVVMPEMDGFEVCSRLKSCPGTLDIPVVFITSMGEEVDHLQGLNVGAIDYIEKPISPEVVRVRVKNHIRVKRKQDTLRGLTLRDGLTGIANRRRFDEALREEWSRAARNQTQLSLIMLDVDHFKIFNDTYGHVAGDDCLRRIAEALTRSLLRPVDMVARFGGEEFVCLLPGTDAAGTQMVAERFRESVISMAIPHEHSPTEPVVTISQGLATMVPVAEATPDLLLVEADNQLYEAKRNGRNRIEKAMASAKPLSRLSGESLGKARPELPTVLLADDDQHMRAILAGRLAFLPANVEVVASAEEALNFLARSRPQLVLSDVVMPGMDGFSLCLKVKENPARRAIPFVLLTSLSRNLRERSALAGADDFLSKLEEDQIFRMRTRFLLELGTLDTAEPGDPAETENPEVFLCSASSTIQKQMEVQLLSANIRVHPASGLEALMQDLELRQPDILVLDLDQDAGQLLDCLARLRSRPDFAALPVLLLAGKGDEDRMLPLEDYITDRLLKPLEAQETRHRIKLLLRLAGVRKRAGRRNP